MNVRHRLLSLAASAALTTAAAAGQGITIDGPHGHSTAAPVEESSSTGGGIPPWEYEYGTKRQPPNLSRKHATSGTRFQSNIRYAGAFPNRRGIDSRRGPFRYRIREFQKRRFADLRPNTQGARFKASTSSYRPATKYTSSFRGRNRFESTIRYRGR